MPPTYRCECIKMLHLKGAEQQAVTICTTLKSKKELLKTSCGKEEKCKLQALFPCPYSSYYLTNDTDRHLYLFNTSNQQLNELFELYLIIMSSAKALNPSKSGFNFVI